MSLAKSWQVFACVLAVYGLLGGAGGPFSLHAGGPLLVMGPDAVLPMPGEDDPEQGEPILWDTSAPIAYRVDGGPLSAVIDNATGIARVESMFDVWELVPTASIAYTNVGSINAVGAFAGGNVDTMAEFNAVEGDCFAGNQSPIIFDEDGSIFAALGFDSSVIGFAGPCSLSVPVPPGRPQILAGRAAMNGLFRDGLPDSPSNPELSDDEFDFAFVHEFGHFSGLGHSQINLVCLTDPGNCGTDHEFGVPLMFPTLLTSVVTTRTAAATMAGDPTLLLSEDDRGFASLGYPSATFEATYGIVEGEVRFSDGLSLAQGVNVIARRIDDPGTPGIDESLRIAISSVSGMLYSGNPGQAITCLNPANTTTCTNLVGSSLFSGGSRLPSERSLFILPLPAGTYTFEVEGLDPGWTGGSSVGPLDPPILLPGGTPEFWNLGDSSTDDPATSNTFDVVPGADVELTPPIILNGTPPRFDSFESSDTTTLFPQTWWEFLHSPPVAKGFEPEVQA